MKTHTVLDEVMIPSEKNKAIAQTKRAVWIKTETDQAMRYFKALIEIEYITLKI